MSFNLLLYSYSFHNDFPLTSKTDTFVNTIKGIPIRDGLDGPESHADALAQVIECAEQIGWRDNTRRVVLLATDISFHVAGDGVSFRRKAKNFVAKVSFF